MTQVSELYKNFFNKDSINIVDTPFIHIINTTKNTSTIDVIIEDTELYYIEKIKEIKESYDIDNIKAIYSKKKSLEIIQKELDIIKLISKYSLQNNKLEYNFIISCLKYLLELSNMLRARLQQPIISISKQNKTNIIRCSYKFCNFKDSCVYNYSKKGNCCYQDHYVHNMVSHDIDALILYIESNNTVDETIIHNKEILKSINTLSFVIGHMETELRTKCMYAEMKDWESFHFIHVVKG
jgi:hypothetical protein